MEEQWATHPRFPDYLFSSLGRVKRAVDSCKHQKAGDLLAGRVHWDGDRLNNSEANLRWATPAENMEDQRRHGTLRVGSAVSNASIDERIAEEILARGARKRGDRKRVASALGISAKLVGRVQRGNTWKHLQGERSPSLIARPFFKRLDAATVAAIIAEHRKSFRGSRAAVGIIDDLSRRYAEPRHVIRAITSKSFVTKFTAAEEMTSPGRSALDQKRNAETCART